MKAITAKTKTLLAMLIALGLAQPAAAENKLTDAEQCVSLARIDRTKVVDDRNILFYMKGSDIYLNQLPHRCPGLRFEEAFMYRTSLTQLCNVDIITVLQNIGFGFSAGPSCGLGMFYPIDDVTAGELLRGEDK